MTLDAKSLAVTEFLFALKACEDTLHEMLPKLRLLPQIKYAYLNGTSFTGKPYHFRRADGTAELLRGAAQLHVTAVLKTQRITEWLIEVYQGETRWLIETSIYVDSNKDSGMDLLRDFPNRYANTLDELIVQIQAAARELVENVDAIDEAVAMDTATV